MTDKNLFYFSLQFFLAAVLLSTVIPAELKLCFLPFRRWDDSRYLNVCMYSLHLHFEILAVAAGF